MSKACLVMDMPESCDVCDLREDSGISCYCGIPGIGENVDDYITCRPDWCPLRPMPEKDMKSYFPDEWQDGYTSGWNACIEAISGRSDG